MLIWFSNPDPVREWLMILKYPLGIVAALVVGWWHKRKQRIALNWPSVQGCVQFVSVAPITDSSDYNAILEYSYFVGEYRSSKCTHVFPSEEDANKFIQTMKDKTISVHYNPRNPDKSVVEDDDIEEQIPFSSSPLA